MSAVGRSIFAIDPGSRKVGWAVVQERAGQVRRVASGVIRLPERLPVTERLGLLHTAIAGLFAEHPCGVLAIEAAFVRDNPQTALVLGMARGVPIGLAAALGWQVAEYPPALVKRTLVGTGRAEKQQMQYMIQLTLGLTEPPGEDEADALSVAVTHLRVSALAMVTPTVAVARMPVESAPLTPAKAAWLAAMAGGKR